MGMIFPFHVPDISVATARSGRVKIPWEAIRGVKINSRLGDTAPLRIATIGKP
jgi:hypothetical protein